MDVEIVFRKKSVRKFAFNLSLSIGDKFYITPNYFPKIAGQTARNEFY